MKTPPELDDAANRVRLISIPFHIEIPTELADAAQSVEQKKPQKLTVRQLLSWYGRSRRGSSIVALIREHLKELNLETDPDFESVYIDAPIYLMPRRAAAAAPDARRPPGEPDDAAATPEVRAPDEAAAPAHRISRLKAANTEPVRVGPDDGIERAVTFMLSNDYSQLPVMTTPTEVKGMISWKSIGRRKTMKIECSFVRDCMDPHREVPSTASMFDVIRELACHDAVLVRNEQHQIVGIVTAADISEQFRTLAEPFLLLGDIETSLRLLINGWFTVEELRAACEPADDNRRIESVGDLTFGGYLRLIQNPDNWTKLALQLDRKVFAKILDDVREIRNDVMHFDPDGIDEDQLAILRRFSRFTAQLVELRAGVTKPLRGDQEIEAPTVTVPPRHEGGRDAVAGKESPRHEQVPQGTGTS